MSNFTHLYLNRLDADPYLHRLIPYLTQYLSDHPRQTLIVLSDKELLTKGLYLSLREHNISTAFYSQYQPLPLNLLNGSFEEVLARLKNMGLIPTDESTQTKSAIPYLALTHALRVVKGVKGNLATFSDVLQFLTQPHTHPETTQWLKQFQQLPVTEEWQVKQHQQTLRWLMEDYFPTLDSKKLPIGSRESLYQAHQPFQEFESEWFKLFRRGVEHRPDVFNQTKVILVDVYHLERLQPQIIEYLMELLASRPNNSQDIQFFIDVTNPPTDDQWEGLLLNQSLEIIQTAHQVKENQLIQTKYDTRSIKFWQYYAVNNKEALLRAIQDFKRPGQVAIEKQRQLEALRREDRLRRVPTPIKTKSTTSVAELDELIDFSDLD